MTDKKEVIYCSKCKMFIECIKTKRCPHCGSLEIHKTNTKPLNLDKTLKDK